MPATRSEPEGTTLPAPQDPPSVLTPLPTPPLDRRGGYGWAMGMIAAAAGVVLLASGYVWVTLPGFGVTAGLGWWLYMSLMMVVPGGVLLGTLACAGVALLRRLGARRWPGPLQALPPVVVLLTATALLVASFFMYAEW